MALQPTGVQAQSVTNYAFSQTAGTYTNITGGTVLISGNNWNNQVFSVTPLTAFPFLGQNQNTMYVSCNGFLTFGTAPAGNNITPLSNGAGYIGAISPFGANLVDRNLPTSEVRWQEVGSEIIVQWRDCRRKIAGNNELFSFQARLNTTNGTIRFVYSAVSNLDNSTAQQPQVGLRGANNTFPANVNARLIATGAETWATTLPATANSSKLRFTSTNPSRSPVSGQTYTFTPFSVLHPRSFRLIPVQPSVLEYRRPSPQYPPTEERHRPTHGRTTGQPLEVAPLIQVHFLPTVTSSP
ncbi:MAG: hypothetical protein IPO90_05155 [Flavobacteriales bacterium]|nr:hypothetical protein [Flavobacteriales bacterium]